MEYRSLESIPGELVAALWRHKFKAAITAVVILALTAGFLVISERQFTSEAKLFVRIGRESVSLDPTATTGSVVSISDTRESELNAISELLSSRSVVEKVVDQYGADVILEKIKPANPQIAAVKKWMSQFDDYNLNPLQVYNLRDKAILHFQEQLHIGLAKKSSVISMSYESASPTLSRDLLESLITIARDDHLRMNRTRGSQEFFDEQAAKLREELESKEKELRDLKNQTGLASLPQQRELQLGSINLLEQELRATTASVRAAKAEVELREKLLVATPAMIITEEVTGQPQTPQASMREKLFDLEVQEKDLSSKLLDDNPRLMQVREQIAQARAVMAEEGMSQQTTRGVNKTRESTELALQEKLAELASLEAKQKVLDTSLAEARGMLQMMNDNEIEIASLERSIELASTNFRKYSENLEQARIDHELEAAKISSINLFQPPSYSETPSSPDTKTTLAAGLVLAMIGGVSVAAFAERRRQLQMYARNLAASSALVASAPPASTAPKSSDEAPEPKGAATTNGAAAAASESRRPRSEHPLPR
ncbi:lipopolysaccharide biosynthesis protein [Pirellula staleyi DSM 6068]|uniref:Lipopolysaccharide biosynthesis protein n=1 Tax=Pirellula staleyi (strain ATCC 27377 / DSM 6068 / ICPB 4128) TaxID=530564 RepID=D2QZ36_PIRSD|nr:Wzz/FepE/Etk N-terminal domain-containing protein [Pirellula staleyi]ADB18228.1 lipopolysaccharide biosynthesis protein [Pirellula staleyi DSM 6068]